jgi:hypothetical protein
VNGEEENRKVIDINNKQHYIKDEECCNAQTIKSERNKISLEVKKSRVLGIEW